jgi:hypothetical protein
MNETLRRIFFGVIALLLAPPAALQAADALPPPAKVDSTHAPAGKDDYSAYGKLLVTQMKSAPFPHPKRAKGYTYKGEVFSSQKCYSDSTVAVFVPKGFRATSRIDFVVHFHGWRGRVKNALTHYQLIEQFAASGRNAVLVVPQGPYNAPDSFGGKLEDPDGFKRFMDEVLGVMKKAAILPPGGSSVGRIILSAHSGGGRVLGEVLAVGGLSDHVSEIWLFDAMYSHTDKYMAWFDQQHGRMLNMYTDSGGTKGNTEKLMASLRKRGTRFAALQDDKFKSDDLKPREPVFLHTDLAHDEVIQKRQAFRTFLETSLLENRAAQQGNANSR